MITIIDGDARDVAAIMRIMNNAFDPSFGEAWTSAQCLSLLTLPACQLVLARRDTEIAGQEVVGFAMSRWVMDEEELLLIGVETKNQRDRIGSMLLQHIISRAQKQGRTKIFLEVRSSNPAQSFYMSRGFVTNGIRKQYYRGADGSSHDAITMALQL